FYFDIDSTSFVLLGKHIGLNNSVIFVAGFMVLLLGVITMAITTGRSFCGWVCPQNFLSEMINKIINKFAVSNGKKKIIPYIVITLATVIISLAVSINFMFYFGSPSDVFNNLISGNLNTNVTIFASIFGLLVFSGIGIFRHDFCKYACPYGIMQASVIDKTTLRVSFAKERSSDCINCEACTDVCYVDIEPRKLVQADPGCMNCGLCVEACHNILEPMGVKSMLDFTAEKDPEKQNLNSKAALILTTTLIFFTIYFSYSFIYLSPVDLTVTRNDAMVSVIKDGKLYSKYFIQVMNQTSEQKDVKVSIEGLSNDFVSFEKREVSLEPAKKERFDMTISTKKTNLKSGFQSFYILIHDKNNNLLNKVKGALFVPFD
ncbi:MAG: 4Fe-4S dicluster domain-containing protein, partial [Candidatus Sericytochromatia bacterium]